MKKTKRFLTTEMLGPVKNKGLNKELTFVTKKSDRSTHNLKKGANLLEKRSRRFSKNMA